MKIAVAGASGYIGGRIVPRLLDAGHDVAVLTRDAGRLRGHPWAEQVRIVEGGLEDPSAAADLCAEADTLYYLVHSMGGPGDFERTERACALTAAVAARDAGVSRIVYLSGLHPEGPLSRHLASRQEAGRILKSSGVALFELQAGLVIGSGSASFEMIRHLTDVLPVMPAPRWVRNRIQPIAVRDALHYLLAVGVADPERAGTYDIGGPDVLTYREMMRTYADAAGLRRPRIVALPVLTPWLAAQWVNLVTPIPRALAIPLVESLQHDCVAGDRRIDRIIDPPAGGLTGYRRSVDLALERLDLDSVETTWATAHAVDQPAEPLPSDPEWAGRTAFVDRREMRSSASPEDLWRVVVAIGGEAGWYSLPPAWRLRGLLDKIVGGAGLTRGRRSRSGLRAGDVVDFWRVEEIEEGRLLRLRADMRVPGQAWLEFAVEPDGTGSRCRQRAVFFPHGLSGRLYWWAMAPFHGTIFSGMARRMVERAEQGGDA
ncbi:SDR family oxidoreductase [Zhihengliuella salsuginis]|uniref:NAD(P)-dependent oxidoreductase n=1 Tax=Zhihengliuella salsuginis TaxID=578222 RepID=A0ABQ3GHF5_9MICC|nr:SDR family oxidoreductase [Zhihengliuella salsuginis]GHD04786.1 NAD(P)-dependent oxidoreductase [Zhihengliuella salsuginis]